VSATRRQPPSEPPPESTPPSPGTSLDAAELAAARTAARDLHGRLYRLHQWAVAGGALEPGEEHRPAGRDFLRWLDETEGLLPTLLPVLERACAAVSALPRGTVRFGDRRARNALTILLELVQDALVHLRGDLDPEADPARPAPPIRDALALQLTEAAGRIWCEQLERKLEPKGQWDCFLYDVEDDLAWVAQAAPQERFPEMRETADAAAAGPASASSGPDGGRAAEQTAGLPWQEAAGRMERLRRQGEPFTSQATLGEQFGCAPSTVNKAIRLTPSLQGWAKRPAAPRRQAPDPDRAQQELKGQAFEDIAQQHEPDPADAVAEADLRKWFENASPDERAFLNIIGDAPNDYKLWYITELPKDRKKHRDLFEKHIGSDVTVLC
jgi:hypothetical protein